MNGSGPPALSACILWAILALFLAAEKERGRGRATLDNVNEENSHSRISSVCKNYIK